MTKPVPHLAKVALAIVIAFLFAFPVLAQEQIIGPPSERVDILAPPPENEPTVDRACLRRQEAAMISGEIVVCGERGRSGSAVTYDRERAERRYAERTRNAGTIPTPDVAGAGIFRGKATLGGICVPGVTNCPPPPALIIDVTALPEAPPGSDADRIARGLAPIGNDMERTAPIPDRQRAELGLPAPHETHQGEAVSPAVSAGPAAPR